MEAARHWGLGARFESGDIQMGDGQHGAMHTYGRMFTFPAWAGGAWNSTNNKQAGAEHVSVA